MNKFKKYIFTFVTVIFIGIVVLYSNNDIGINQVNIEKDARATQRIPDDWQVAKVMTDTIASMIFYSDNVDHHTFSIYVNRPRLSFGYFFRGGGSVVETEKYVAEFLIEGYDERIFISMNKQQVSKVKIDNGKGIKTIEIDSKKPFTFIVPDNVGSVTLYDINGNILKSMQHKL